MQKIVFLQPLPLPDNHIDWAKNSVFEQVDKPKAPLECFVLCSGQKITQATTPQEDHQFLFLESRGWEVPTIVYARVNIC